MTGTWTVYKTHKRLYETKACLYIYFFSDMSQLLPVHSAPEYSIIFNASDDLSYNGNILQELRKNLHFILQKEVNKH